MSYLQVTFGELKADLHSRVDNTPFFSDAELGNAINAALRTWNMMTGKFKTRETVLSVANQVYYTLSSTLLYGLRSSTSDYPIAYSTLSDIDNAHPGWEGETTATGGTVPTRVKLVIPIGINKVAFWPAPAVANLAIILDAVAATPVLTEGYQFVQLGKEEHSAILGYGQHRLMLKLGGDHFKETIPLYKGFVEAAVLCNARLKESTFFRNVMGLDSNRAARPLEATPQEEGA